MRILIREGERPRISIFFFKAVVQFVLLFGEETWVVTPSHGTGPIMVPGPGGSDTGREAPVAARRRYVGVNLDGSGASRGGV